MSALRIVLAASAICTLVVSSNETLSQPKNEKAKTIVERLSELETKVGVLEFQTEVFQNRRRPVYAHLDCDSKKFGVVETDDPARLLIMVSCVNIEPYLEGYKVSLDIGNPYSARFSGVKGSLIYGSTFPKKKVEIPLTSGLNGGQWTRVAVSISQAQAAEMRSMSAEFFVEQMALGRNY